MWGARMCPGSCWVDSSDWWWGPAFAWGEYYQIQTTLRCLLAAPSQHNWNFQLWFEQRESVGGCSSGKQRGHKSHGFSQKEEGRGCVQTFKPMCFAFLMFFFFCSKALRCFVAVIVLCSIIIKYIKLLLLLLLLLIHTLFVLALCNLVMVSWMLIVN